MSGRRLEQEASRMAKPPSTDKQRRAAAFEPRPGPTPQTGRLEIRWASAFDRSCFLVSTQGLNARHHQAYQAMMEDLRARTGCTEAEILAHGNKVRSVISLVENRLERSGVFANLAGGQKYLHQLSAIPPAFD